jgi:acyl-[acyl-carrier-protein] desaturase
MDYVNILNSLIDEWKIDTITNLSDAAEKGRDYIMALPNRLQRLAERITPKQTVYKFSWIYG